MSYSLGVDLGTTFIGAAVARRGGVSMVSLAEASVVAPALVYLGEDGELATGDRARRLSVTRPDKLCRDIKRRLGDPTPIMLGGRPFAPADLLGALLHDAVRRVAELEGGRPEQVVLTHPANWGPFRRGLFEEVPVVAGLTDPVTITEPEAAAAFYAAARQVRDGQTMAVYDLGGGTFDATVLRGGPQGVEIIGTPQGVERLGGVDLDDSVMAYVNTVLGGVLDELNLDDPAATIAAARLRQECVLAKEALSRDTEVTIPVFLPGLSAAVRLTRPDFEDLVRDPIHSTTEVLLRAVRAADVEPSDLDAVLLVGGSSRIPLVAELVSQQLGCPTVVDAHPKHAVALGAATLAARRANPGPHESRVTNHSAFTAVGVPPVDRSDPARVASVVDASAGSNLGQRRAPPLPPPPMRLPPPGSGGPRFPPPGPAGSTFPPTGPGFPPTGPGFLPTGPGFPPTGPGFPPTGPGFPPTGPGFPPTGPGFPPTGPGFPPTGPGFPAAEPAPAPPIPSLAPDPWSRALSVPLVLGCAAAVLLGVYARVHQPSGFAINLTGFSSGQYVKAWLATLAALFGIIQLVTASQMHATRSTPPPPGMATFHRWSGRIAVLLTVPVAVHCMYALGFQTASPRVLVHSLLGCVFYGAFVTKMLTLTRRGTPKWAQPVLGGLVFTALIGLWMSSALWLFQVKGLHF